MGGGDQLCRCVLLACDSPSTLSSTGTEVSEAGASSLEGGSSGGSLGPGAMAASSRQNGQGASCSNEPRACMHATGFRHCTLCVFRKAPYQKSSLICDPQKRALACCAFKASIILALPVWTLLTSSLALLPCSSPCGLTWPSMTQHESQSLTCILLAIPKSAHWEQCSHCILVAFSLLTLRL